MINLVRCLLILLGTGILTPAQAAPLTEKDYIKLSAAGLFFNKPTGSIAFLPKVGDELYLSKVRTHYLLPESGFYRLPKKGNYFFRINHRGESEETSYIGVTAYLVYPSTFGHRNALNLTRNQANWHPGETGRTLDKARTGPSSPDNTIEDFFNAHAADKKNSKEADAVLNFTWHAAVEGGAPYSWQYRSRWHNAQPPLLDAFLKQMSLSRTDYKAAITAHLLQFTMTRTPVKPLDFWFNADHASGAYVRVFSPASPVFEKEFYFVFE